RPQTGLLVLLEGPARILRLLRLGRPVQGGRRLPGEACLARLRRDHPRQDAPVAAARRSAVAQRDPRLAAGGCTEVERDCAGVARADLEPARDDALRRRRPREAGAGALDPRLVAGPGAVEDRLAIG